MYVKEVGRWSCNLHVCKELNLSPIALKKHLIPNKGEKPLKRVKQYIFILESENIEKIKKQKILAIINCNGNLNKSFVRKNPSILNIIK